MTPPPLDGFSSARTAVFEALIDGFTPPPPLNLSKWAQKNIVFGNDSDFQGPYDPKLVPFFEDILACLQPDHPARNVTLMKSAQCGGTILANIFVGGYLDMDPGPMLYVHPSLDNCKRWARTKWKPFVRGSESLRRIFPDEKTRDAANTIYYKERADERGHLLLSGANSPSSLSQVSYPRQVQDDLSKWENSESAGDPESLADSRSKAFQYAKIFKISTPLIKGACRISAAYDQGTQGELEVPCPHCGHYQVLEWENLKKSLLDGMDPDKAHFTCVQNGCVIEHHYKLWMIARYRWVFRNPDAKDWSFKVWGAYSPFTTWSLIVSAWLKAEGDPKKEQTFLNDDIGLPYEQKGEAPPWQEIKKRATQEDVTPEERALRIYHRGSIPLNALLITCGVDCQGDRIEWHVKGFGPNLRRYTIEHGVIDGHISQDGPRKQLDALLKRTWPNALGRQIGIDMLAIDANYDTQQVMDWAKKHPDNRVIAVRGSKGEHTPPLMAVKYERIKGMRVRKHQRKFFNVGTAGLKIALFKQLEIADPHARGYCGYPADLDDEFFRQLCSERRVMKTHKRTNFAILEWQKLPNTRNEILDTEIYAEAAARRLGWTEISDARWDQLRAEREIAPKEQQMDLLDPNLATTDPDDAVRGVDVVDVPEEEDAVPPPEPAPPAVKTISSRLA